MNRYEEPPLATADDDQILDHIWDTMTEDIPLSADDQWGTLSGDSAGAPFTASVHRATGAMGKDEAQSVPPGSVVGMSGMPDGDRAWQVTDHDPHEHANFVTPRLHQLSGAPINAGDETHMGHVCSACEHGNAMGWPVSLDVTEPMPLMMAADAYKHDYATTHIELPPEMAKKVKEFAGTISDEDLAEDGRESNPHVTIKYGLHPNSPTSVKSALEDQMPARFSLGHLKVFPANDKRQSDVLVAGVNGKDLHRLNQAVAASTPHTDTYPNYQPHVTVEYLKPGMGQKYAASDALDGMEGFTDEVVHSDRNKNETRLPLNGKTLMMAADAELTGGNWVTINGAKVYIKDGKAIAGPGHLVGKSPAEISGHGAAPAKKEGFHPIERDAKGNYAGSDAEHAARLKDLKLPPGWTDVHLSENADAPLQALGKDSKGRRQYRYSEAHSQAASAKKFARVKGFIENLPEIRNQITNHPSEEAGVLRLIDKTGLRIGGSADTKAEKQAFGASTLKGEHVIQTPEGKTALHFVGKKGVDIHQEINDEGLANELKTRAKNSAENGGKLYNTTDSKVRDHLHEIAPGYKVKDFRTAVAADTALKEMKGIAAPTSEKELKAAKLQVGTAVAAKLGNTPAVALKSYIPPEVFAEWEASSAKGGSGAGKTAAASGTRAGKRKLALSSEGRQLYQSADGSEGLSDERDGARSGRRGRDGRLELASDPGEWHWVTIDEHPVYLAGAPGSKGDLRTRVVHDGKVIPRHEYDKLPDSEKGKDFDKMHGAHFAGQAKHSVVETTKGNTSVKVEGTKVSVEHTTAAEPAKSDVPQAHEMTRTQFLNRTPGVMVEGLKGLKPDYPDKVSAAEEKSSSALDEVHKAGVSHVINSPSQESYLPVSKQKIVKKYRNAANERDALRRESEDEIQGSLHRKSIDKAISEGKSVPAEVLKDYPDLAEKVSPSRPAGGTDPDSIRRSQQAVQSAQARPGHEMVKVYDKASGTSHQVEVPVSKGSAAPSAHDPISHMKGPWDEPTTSAGVTEHATHDAAMEHKAAVVNSAMDAAKADGWFVGAHHEVKEPESYPNLSPQAKEDLDYVIKNPGSRAGVIGKKEMNELTKAGAIRTEASSGVVKVYPAYPAARTESTSKSVAPESNPLATIQNTAKPTLTRHDYAEHIADTLNEKGYSARAWHGGSSHRVYVKSEGKNAGHIEVERDGNVNPALQRQKGAIMSHIPEANVIPEKKINAPRPHDRDEDERDFEESMRKIAHGEAYSADTADPIALSGGNYVLGMDADTIRQIGDSSEGAPEACEDSLALMFGNAPSPYSEAESGTDWKHPASRNGQPCFYYWKEALPVGQFRDSNGTLHKVPAERIERIVNTFKLAASRGHEPFLPDAHTKKDRKRNFGYLVDARKSDNGSVEYLHQFIGEDAKNEAMKNKSSICILPMFEDEKGNTYEDFTDHNAILPNPRIAQLGDFQPAMAASSDRAITAVFLTPVAGTSPDGDPMKDDEIEQVRRLIADSDPDAAMGMNADNWHDKLKTHMKKIGKAAGMAKAHIAASREFTGLEKLETDEALPTVLRMGRDADTRAKDLEAKLKKATTELEAANQKVMTFSRDNPAPAKPSKSELVFASRAVLAARQANLASGALTPAVADEAERLYLKKPIELKALTMSRDIEDGDEVLRDGMLELMKFHEVVSSNTIAPPPTGGMRLSQREVPGSRDSAVDKKLQDKWDEEEKAAKEERLQSPGAR